MENINSTNLFNINQIKSPYLKNSQNPLNDFTNKNNNPELLNNASLINTGLIFNYENAKMDNEQFLKFLQMVLKLPNSIDELLKNITDKNKNTVDIKALLNILTAKSSNAKESALQIISDIAKTQNGDISQIREVLSVVLTIANNNQNLDTTLKELILLYIPINFEALNKEVNFEVSSFEEEKINSSSLSIMFETINFSNILCCIKESGNNIFVDLFVNKNFPINKFTVLAKEYRAKTSIPITFDFNIKENKQNNKKEPLQNLKVISSGQISSIVLSLAYYISKTVFKIDSDFN